MSSLPFFSIIIPTYNRAQYLVATLESVLKQTYPHYEILIVDDGSTDQTKQVVESFKSPFLHYIYQDNGERGKARNKGIEAAKGEYITFLDSDDLFYPHHLQVAAEQIVRYRYPFVYRQNYELKSSNGKLQTRPEKLKGDANKEILKGNFFSCIGVFVHRNVAKEHHFCEDRRLSYTEDWEYWLRLSVRFKFYNNNQITCCMIDHSSRSSRQFNAQKMKILSALLLFNLRNDTVFLVTRKKYLPQIKANMLSLIALMKVSAGQNEKVWHYVTRAIYLSPREIIRKRTFAIAKHYALNLLTK